MAAVTWLSVPAMGRTLGSALIENDGFASADAAAVELGACPDLGLIRHAAELLKAGRVQRVLLVTYIQSARLKAAGINLPIRFDEVLGLYAVDAGLDRRAFEIARVQAIDPITLNVARQVTSLATRRGLRSIAVVCPPFHSRRSTLAYRASAHGSLVVYASPPLDSIDASTWWHTKDGVITVANEWVRMIYYRAVL